MAVTAGTTIGESEYTTLRSKMLTVMGTPSGTGTAAAGYLQTTTAPAVNPGDKILASQWNALKADITRAFTHQTNAAPSAPALVTVDTDTGITAAIHNDYETVANFITNDANRFSLGAAQSTTTSARSKTANNWNGTIIHDVTFTWASANDAKAFFNAGGYLRMSSTLSYTGGEAKTLQWKSMLSDSSVIALNHISAYKETGTSGTISNNDGYYDINGTERELYVQNNSANPYSENRYKILARSITNGLRVRLVYEDNDVGDQTGSGPAVDENVQGTLTSAFSYVRATGSAVEVNAPTIATGGTNTFT
jgi:hypothetical protein